MFVWLLTGSGKSGLLPAVFDILRGMVHRCCIYMYNNLYTSLVNQPVFSTHARGKKNGFLKSSPECVRDHKLGNLHREYNYWYARGVARFRDEDVRMALNKCAARAGYSLRPLQEQE